MLPYFAGERSPIFDADARGLIVGLLAAIGVGLTDKSTDWTVVQHIIEPNAENASVYDDLYAIFRELYPAK